MRTLREGELTLNLPTPIDVSSINLDGARQAIVCPSGRLAVEMDPPREKQGDLWLPDGVGARLRADCGTVVSVGEGVDLQPGDRVLIRPYHGLWIEPFCSEQPELDELAHIQSPVRAGQGKILIVVDAPETWTSLEVSAASPSDAICTGRVLESGCDHWPARGARVVFSNFHPLSGQLGVDQIDEGVVAVPVAHVYAVLRPSSYEAHQIRFFGAVTPWRESILMLKRKAAVQLSNLAIEGEGEWIPISPWVLIERDLTPYHGIHLPEIAAARLRHRARVVKCGSGEIPDGAEVLMESDPRGALSFDLGDVQRCRQLVHEKSIWAIVGT